MRVCKQIKCDKKLWAYGYCGMHGQRYKLYGDPLFTKNERHGMRRTAEYRSWHHMIERCYNPKDKRYNRYGGRGIKVCGKWQTSFMAFYKDMGSKPTPIHQLDRLNNDGDYSPKNCRWATPSEQANNRSTNRLFTYNNMTKNMRGWSEYSNIEYHKLRQRLMKYNWPIEKALTKG